jgi:diaminopimelate decarboxylase
VARVRLRLNPATTARAYRVPMMGLPSPFGIDEEQLAEAMARVTAQAGVLELDGLHVHPGGQCTSVGGFTAAAAASLDLCARLQREHGVKAARLNLGGGLGVLGSGEELEVEAAGRKLKVMVDKYREAMGHAPELLLEPGRWLAAPAGLYVARVVSTKQSRGRRFVVLDGGMNHHLAATGQLFGADAPRLPLHNLSRPDAPAVTCTVVGPLCTPLDVLGEAVTLPEPVVGELIGIPASGAYGPSFSPVNFLGHPAPVEVVIGE